MKTTGPGPVDLGDHRGPLGGDRADKPLPQLLAELSREMSLLVHEEVQLAKVELTDKARKMAAGAVLFAVAAALGLMAAGAFVACMVIALAIVLPWWLSAVIIGSVMLVGALMAAGGGLAAARKAAPPVPSQAMESAKEDVAWLQKQLKSARQ